jgi:hypothetical protein
VRYTAYYAIRGRPALRQLLHEKGFEHADALTEPVLWSNEQGGRTAAMPEDFAAAVKRLYVAWARYVVLGPDETRRIFGDLPVSETVFDRWWHAEQFDGLDSSTADILTDLQTVQGLDLRELLGPYSVLERQ